MSKGSKPRPIQVSEAQFQMNWEVIFGKTSVYVWPDGSWCELDELEDMSHLSDDFTKVKLSSSEYEELLEGKIDPQKFL